MALPWLIGAAVLGVGAWIASSSSDNSNSGGNGDDEERRRREQAERERHEREKQEERQSIKAALKEEGKRRSVDFQITLQGWINVHYRSTPPFKASILQTGKQYKRVVAQNFSDSDGLSLLTDGTRKNLNQFEACYDVELTKSEALNDAINEILGYQKQLQKLLDSRKKLEQKRQELSR